MEVAEGELDEFGHVRSAASATVSSARSRSAPGSRRARWCSATSSAAARRPRSTGSSRRASVVAAIDAAHDGRWGTMPALRGTRIELVALAEAVESLRTVPHEDYEVAAPFLGYAAQAESAASLPARSPRSRRWPWQGSYRVRLAGRWNPVRRVRDRLRQHAAARPGSASGRDAADGARLALADTQGKVGELAVRARYLDDTAGRAGSARWSRRGRGGQRSPGRRGLDRDRVHRGLRLRSDAILAADHQRGPHPAGLARELGRRPGPALRRRWGPGPCGRPAHRASAPSGG